MTLVLLVTLLLLALSALGVVGVIHNYHHETRYARDLRHHHETVTHANDHPTR